MILYRYKRDLHSRRTTRLVCHQGQGQIPRSQIICIYRTHGKCKVSIPRHMLLHLIYLFNKIIFSTLTILQDLYFRKFKGKHDSFVYKSRIYFYRYSYIHIHEREEEEKEKERNYPIQLQQAWSRPRSSHIRDRARDLEKIKILIHNYSI